MSRTRSLTAIAGLAAVLVAAFLTAAPLCAQETKPKHYALLVGVKEYDHRKLPPLRYTENDATEVATLLRGAGYEVVLLTSTDGKKNAKAKPTRANIEKQLKDILAKCKKGDTVLVALAGHGLQFDTVEDSFFCPEDALPFSDADSLKTLLSLKTVYQQLDRSQGAVKLLLVDACRNDPSQGRSVGAIGAGAPPAGVAALFSCSAGERAYEVDNYKHGIFFYHVLEGLRGKAKTTDEDEVTWDALQAYVRGKVSDDAPKLLDGAHQTPSLNTGELSGKSPILIERHIKLAVRARLSLYFNALDRQAAERLHLPQQSQAQVLFVVPGGGGDSMGLKAGDVIRRVNGRDIETVFKASDLFHELALGDRVEMEVVRDKQKLKLTGRYETPLTKAEEVKRVRELAEKDDAAAVHYLGHLYETGQCVMQDEKEAARWYRKAADLNYTFAQHSLADLYAEGRGVAKDESEALKWYRKAANQGFAAAQNSLGVRLQNGRGIPKDEAEAAKWYRKAAEQGYAQAQYNLGNLCETGRGVAKNETEAATWYRKAADQGNGLAQTQLGVCYAAGRGVTKDETEAVKWYRKAADQGESDAWNRLGGMYASGRGVTKDETEAVNCYRKSAEKGNAPAQDNLGICYATGRGVTKDESEAAKWYRKAAEQGNSSAQTNLGASYANGRGVIQDDAEAVKWYRKAAEQGNAVAQTHLGYMCGKGRGTAKDDAESARWYRKAADQGNAVAELNLGLCYANGRGLPRDRKIAITWLRKSAAQGNDSAVRALKRLGDRS